MRRRETEMQEEMAAHLERAVARFVARGMSPGDAAAAARREFGNVPAIQEEARDARGRRWLEALAGDTRAALRYFRRNRFATAVLVVVLALGIGVNGAFISMVQAMYFRPAPGVAADPALTMIYGLEGTRSHPRYERALSWPEYRAIAARRDLFPVTAAWHRTATVARTRDGAPRSAQLVRVTPEYFRIGRVGLALGTGLSASDGPGEVARQVVISDAFWRRAFAGRPDVIGQPLRVGDTELLVTGVAPPRFEGLDGDLESEVLWVPVDMASSVARGANDETPLFSIVARRAPGVSLAAARSAVEAVARTWSTPESWPPGVTSRGADAVALTGYVRLDDRGDYRVVLIGLGGTAILILLVACTNVAALLLGAAVARRQEIGVRLALGASRGRIVRQLLTESVLVALAGSALGLALFMGAARYLETVGLGLTLAPDTGTLLLTGGFAVVTGVLFGLSPALHATRGGVAVALRQSGGGATSRSRLQRALIVAQVAFTQPLLVALGVIVSSDVVPRDRRHDLPATPYLAEVSVESWVMTGKDSLRQARLAAFESGLRRDPAIAAVARASVVSRSLQVRRPDGSVLALRALHTDPGYFATTGIALRGRSFVAGDADGRDLSIVIDTALARAIWGDRDPVGQRLAAEVDTAGAIGAVMVGVASIAGASRNEVVEVYTANTPDTPVSRWVVRTHEPIGRVASPLARRVQEALPDLPTSIRTYPEIVRADAVERAQTGVISGAGGALALLLASIGLYGVIALAVRQRRREIGIRIAVGAGQRRVVGLFFAQGLRLAIIGMLIGLPLSLAGLRALGLLPDVQKSFAILPIGLGVAVAVTTFTALASWLPARRAARVDPVEVLRGA